MIAIDHDESVTIQDKESFIIGARSDRLPSITKLFGVFRGMSKDSVQSSHTCKKNY